MKALLKPFAVLISAFLALWLPACAGGDTPDATPTPIFVRLVPPAQSAQLVFTSNLYTGAPGAGRETHAVALDGSALTRLTFCNEGPVACDIVEAAPAGDRARFAVRLVRDENGDSLFTDADPVSFVFQDLVRGVQATFLQGTTGGSGIDWTADANFIFFSARGDSSFDDLYTANGKGETASIQNISRTMSLNERRTRLRSDGNAGVFERIAADTPAAIFHVSVGLPTAVSRKEPGGALLAGTPYRLGSDTDPAFSPDGRLVVFRRLTALTADGRGEWDIVAAGADGTSPRVLVSGPAFRGAPAWGSRGIAFPEADASGAMALVVVDTTGADRRVVLTAPSGAAISNPRWLAENP